MSYLNTDVPELKGYDTGTVLSNLETLEIRMEHLCEATVAELFELSDAILQDAGGDPDTVFSILLSLRGQPDRDTASPLKSRHLLWENVPILEGINRHLGLYERLTLYQLITEKMPRLPILTHRDDTLLPAAAKGRIAYMTGSFVDKAYIRFAEELPHCRAAGFHSFIDACEEVWGGLCEYCILPLENSVEGKLPGFAKLMVKYRLHIIAVCDVTGTGGRGEETTRFALLRLADEDRAAEISPLATRDHPVTHIELLHTTASPGFSEIVAAAEFCGLSLARADTLPAEELYPLLSGNSFSADKEPVAPLISTVWETEKSALSAFLCYLSLEASDDPILGLYPHLS
ncbi:MAG: hypothetical protein E7661_01320 [Ruminococcaceae bacterium]|nr:hypothetical protein [Oscillospiraceae bacterium]